jgi:hypothetical protein
MYDGVLIAQYQGLHGFNVLRIPLSWSRGSRYQFHPAWQGHATCANIHMIQHEEGIEV